MRHSFQGRCANGVEVADAGDQVVVCVRWHQAALDWGSDLSSHGGFF